MASFNIRMKNKIRELAHRTAEYFKADDPKAPPGAYHYLVKPNQEAFALVGADFEKWVNEAYKGNETINGALNLMADTLVEAPLIVVDAKDEEKRLPDHATQQALDRKTDKYASQQMLIRQMFMHLMLGSVAFLEKVKRGNEIREFGMLRPDKVAIVTDDRSIVKFRYFIGGKIVDLKPDQLIPVRYLDPLDDFKGFSPLWSLAVRTDGENLASKYVVNTLANGGQPGTHITVPDETAPEEKDALGISYDRKVGGDQTGSTLVTDAGVEIHTFGFSFKDLDLTALGNNSESKILSTLHIPLQVYGSISGQQVTTRDNMKTAYRMFWRHNIIPLQTMIESYFNSDFDITDGFTVKVKFDRSKIDALKDDAVELSERAGKGYERQIWKLNEARAADGLDPVAGGDVVKQITAAAPVATENEDEEEEDKNPKAKSASIDININHKSEQIAAETIPAKTKEDLELEIETKIATERMDLADTFLLDVAIMADKRLNSQIRDVLKVVGNKAGKSVKTFEQERIMNGVRELAGQWEIELETDSLKTLGKLTAESAEIASVGIGHSFELEAVEAKQAVQAEAFKFAKKVTNTSSEQVKTVIHGAFSEGKSLGELAKDLKKLNDQWSDSRVKMIARTETAKAANRGADIAYKQAGVTHYRYSAVLDSATSEICQHLNGKIVQSGSPFLTQKEGFIDSKGTSANLSYNDGVPLPGDAHPNCRSTLIPVESDGSILFKGNG
jgi:HK97 family phage portal protein